MSPVNRNSCSYNRYPAASPRVMSGTKSTESMSAGSVSSDSCGNLESMSRTLLWNRINEVSFAIDDMLLYLDTHPWDTDALASIRQLILQRDQALKIYAGKFEPLTIDTTAESSSAAWDWILQPWPWEITEKGGCR